MANDPKYGKLYNALSGLELRKKILHDVEVMLDSDDRFRNHITYPRVKYRFDLTLEVYPADPDTFSLAVEKQHGDTDTGGKPRTIHIESQTPHEHPDKVRQEIGLPVPRPQATGEGIVELTKAQAEEQSDNRLVRTVEEAPAQPTPVAAGADPHVVITGAGGTSRIEKTEIPGHAVSRPLVIPREPANPKVSIANNAAMDGAFGAPVEVEIVPRGQ